MLLIQPEKEIHLIGMGGMKTNSQKENQKSIFIYRYIKKKTDRQDKLLLTGLMSVLFIGIPILAVIQGVSQ